MGKPIYLSDDDCEKFDYLKDSNRMWGIPEQEGIKIIIELKNKYNINQLPIDIPLGSIETKRSAARTYLDCLYTLHAQGNKHYTEELEKYLKKKIKEITKYLEKNVDDNLIVTHNLLSLLMILTKVYDGTNNKNSYIQTAYKLFKLYYSSIPALLKKEFNIDHSSIKIYLDYLLVLKDGQSFFGNNEKLLESYITALVTADDPYPILILGESGTGKENLANHIHKVSSRIENPFQALNCAAIPDTLFDSEISGIIRGVATNVSSRLGIFLAACSNNDMGYRVNNNGEIVFKHGGKEKEPTESELRRIGGTVFLDEINSIPPHLQAKLLRNIEENEVRVIGEERSRKFNVKLICSANTDLYNEIRTGKFREDLYHRISGQILRLPSLREMKESLDEIAQSKLSEILKEIGYVKSIQLSKAAKNKIQNYDWPGNFRELNNILYRAITEIRLEGKNIINGSNIVLPSTETTYSKPINSSLSEMSHAELEKSYIISILKKAGGNITKATEIAGFGTRTPLFTRMKKYGIQ